jgi:hypothetical protein
MYAQKTTTPDIPTLRGEDTLIHQHILSLSRRVFNSPVISTFTIFIQPLGTLAVFSLLNYTVIVEDPI